MKIVLINPPAVFLEDQGVFPPLGLWYVGTSLTSFGHDVRWVDVGLGDAIEDADIYGITATTPQAEAMRDVIKSLVGRGRIIAGGPHATLHPEEILEWGADTVIKGEGEWAILRAVHDGATGVISEPRMTGHQLDRLPIVSRPGAWRYRYLLAGEPATTMMTSRGCPFKCAFCCHAIWGEQTSFRSAENVLRECAMLKGMGWKRLMFFDDTFVLNRPRLHEICEGLQEMGFKWRCFVRADVTTKEDLELMAKAGCVEVGIGVESGDQRILNNVMKRTTVEQNSEIVRNCKEAGIDAKTFIIIGLPGENEESLANTKKWLTENRPPKADVTLYTPYSDTPITLHPELYDIHYDPVPDGQLWYKGHQDEAVSHVSTMALSRERLTEARGEIEHAWRSALCS